MKKHVDKKNDSGLIRLNENFIFWDCQGENILQINVDDIVIIGENTNSDGPWFDDWFLTFVLKDGTWQNIPRDVDNNEELTSYLSKKFNIDFSGSLLIGSTVWNSVVRYPSDYEGQKLFHLTPTKDYKVPKNFFDKILFSLGLGNFNSTQKVELTPEMKKLI